MIEAGLVFNGLVCAILLRQPDEAKVDRDKSGQSLLNTNEEHNALETNFEHDTNVDECEKAYDTVLECKSDISKEGLLADSLVNG